MKEKRILKILRKVLTFNKKCVIIYIGGTDYKSAVIVKVNLFT